MNWEALSTTDQRNVLVHLTKTISDQIGRVLDGGDKELIGDSIIISNGDLSEQVGMFRVNRNNVSIKDVGAVSQRSPIIPNVIIAVRTAKTRDGEDIVAIRGITMGGTTIGFYHMVSTRDGKLVRIGEVRTMPDDEDIGGLRDEVIGMFLLGREDAAVGQGPRVDVKGRHTFEHDNRVSTQGSYWMELKK